MGWIGFPIVVWVVVLGVLLTIGRLSLASRGWRCEGECQLAYLLAIAVVGVMTIACLQAGSLDWILGCLTLVGSVCGAALNSSFESQEPAI